MASIFSSEKTVFIGVDYTADKNLAIPTMVLILGGSGLPGLTVTDYAEVDNELLQVKGWGFTKA